MRRIFSEIAPRYDLLNHLLSLNIDRRLAPRAHSPHWGGSDRPEGTYLDLCAGTLDVGAMLARAPGFRGAVLGADFAEPMLRAGRRQGRPQRRWLPSRPTRSRCRCATSRIDGAIVAFGIRNVADLDAGCARCIACWRPARAS